MSTTNKTAVITGANSGIGLALTQKLLDEGYAVTGTSRSGEIPDLSHPQLNVVQLDITDENSIHRAATQIQQLAGSLQLLVNNAGIAPDVMATEPELQSFRSTFDTNVTGTVFFTELLLNSVAAGGQIIFISSAMGLPRNAAPNGPGYRMSKAALNMYAAMLAQRVAGRDIRVTPMHPGWVQTKLGGSQAPFTAAQSAEGIFNGITSRPESGRFWNIETNSLVEY